MGDLSLFVLIKWGPIKRRKIVLRGYFNVAYELKLGGQCLFLLKIVVEFSKDNL